jgi:hypothetical protein
MSQKQKISGALREQVWLQRAGPVYSAKCSVVWCQNKMTVFNFHCGHNIPESKGGETDLNNLFPLCDRCNVSMGNRYTIEEWNRISSPLARSWFSKIKCWNA